MADHDALTGLPGAAFFEKAWNDQQAGERAPGTIVVNIQLNNLTDINHDAGIGAGDECLSELANRLRSVLGNKGKVFRVQGSTFMALVDAYSGASSLEAVVRRLMIHLNEPVFSDSQLLFSLVKIDAKTLSDYTRTQARQVRGDRGGPRKKIVRQES